MRIKELIKEKGFTQKEFADKLGMTTVGLSHLTLPLRKLRLLLM